MSAEILIIDDNSDIRFILDELIKEAGYKTITWNGMNQTGRLVSAGMYFYAIQANDYRQVRKMILLK